MPKKETATFAAGCFWGVEEAFRQLKGVLSTMAGYSGGSLNNPSYEDVCTDSTGHAEAVQITYDPRQISYKELLDIFWSSHDPTQLNRQGPDVGTQYRSAIFFHSKGQEQLATKSRDEMQKKLGRKIATEIVAAEAFYKAEEYHQQYLRKKGVRVYH